MAVTVYTPNPRTCDSSSERKNNQRLRFPLVIGCPGILPALAMASTVDRAILRNAAASSGLMGRPPDLHRSWSPLPGFSIWKTGVTALPGSSYLAPNSRDDAAVIRGLFMARLHGCRIGWLAADAGFSVEEGFQSGGEQFRCSLQRPHACLPYRPPFASTQVLSPPLLPFT